MTEARTRFSTGSAAGSPAGLQEESSGYEPYTPSDAETCGACWSPAISC